MKKIIYIAGFMLAMVFTAHAQDCATGYCPKTLRVEHKAGTVSPLTQTTTYGVVETKLSGTTACWITRNLGATAQATSANDATVGARGWFWQFNKKQGYSHNGTTRTPSVVNWITSINEDSNWLPGNDPCALLLGANWRIPTTAEWTNVLATANNFTNAYNSVLKLNATGRLGTDGTFGSGGTSFYYQIQEQESPTNGRFVGGTSTLGVINYSKAEAYAVRCIRTY